MHAMIEDAIARVEQLYATITGHAPPEPNGSGARIPPETDPARHVEEQLEKLIAIAGQLATRRAPVEPRLAGAGARIEPDPGSGNHTKEEGTMETVKVDIQKLQLLNDRIAQTIEALNQMRMSVHGIQQTWAQQPWAQQPWTQQPWTQQPWTQQPWGFGPYASAPFAPQYPQPFAPWQGMSHTSAPMPHTPWEPSWQTRTPTTYPWTQGWWTTPTMF